MQGRTAAGSRYLYLSLSVAQMHFAAGAAQAFFVRIYDIFASVLSEEV
jgi:hypothetical protein